MPPPPPPPSPRGRTTPPIAGGKPVAAPSLTSMVFEDDDNLGVLRTGSPRELPPEKTPPAPKPAPAAEESQEETNERPEAAPRRGSASLASLRWRAAGVTAMALLYLPSAAACGWLLAWTLPEIIHNKEVPNLVRGGLAAYLAMFALAGAAFVLWMGKAARIVRRFGNVTPLKSGLTPALWFLVPVFASWRPYLLMRALWQGSRNPADWDNVPIPQTLRLWWTAWTAHKLFFIGGLCVEWIVVGERKFTLETIAIWGFFGTGILAALCLTVIVLQVTRALGQRLG